MIIIENAKVTGWESAIRGMRNPMNSWERSDSKFDHEDCIIGENDFKLMSKLANAGSVHGKYRRMILVYVDITAPLYWWKEYDTYKVGTVANSCSTMHKIHEKKFDIDDFSHDHLDGETRPLFTDRNLVNDDGHHGMYKCSAYDFLCITCDVLNHYRELYLETKDKKYWWQMIQLLPSSYNQKRTLLLNYEVLSNIYKYRRNHKLDEWCIFCKWIEQLPYSKFITCNAEEDVQ